MEKKKLKQIICDNCLEEVFDYHIIASDRPYINLYLCPDCIMLLSDEEVESLIWKKKLAYGKKALGRDDYRKNIIG